MGDCVGKIDSVVSARRNTSTSVDQKGKEVTLTPFLLNVENIENPSLQEVKKIIQILDVILKSLSSQNYFEYMPLNKDIFKVVRVLGNENITKYITTSDIIRYQYQIVKYLYFYGKDEESLPILAELQKKRVGIEEKFSWLNIKLFKLMIIYRVKLKLTESSQNLSFVEECFEVLRLLRTPRQKEMTNFIFCLYKHYHLAIKYKIQEQFQHLDGKELKYFEQEKQNLDTLQKQLKNVKQTTMNCRISVQERNQKIEWKNSIEFNYSSLFSFYRLKEKNQQERKFLDSQTSHYLQKMLPQIRQKESEKQYQKLSKSSFYLWEKNQLSNLQSKLLRNDRKRPIIFPFMNISAFYFSLKEEQNRIQLFRHKKFVQMGEQVWKKLNYFGSGMELHFIWQLKKQFREQKQQKLLEQKQSKKPEVVADPHNQQKLEDTDQEQLSSYKKGKLQNSEPKSSTIPDIQSEKYKLESTTLEENKKHQKQGQERQKNWIKQKLESSPHPHSKRHISHSIYPETSKNSNFSFHQTESARVQSFGYSYNEVGGLENIGNTCYLNSALQCLHKTLPFQQNFINHMSKIMHKGIKPLSCEYFQLIGILWDQRKRKNYRPENIKKIIAESNILFEDFKQNDAMECLNTFLQVIGEELNTAPQQILKVKIDHGKMSDYQIYARTKEKNEAREKSIIDDTFTGRYKTTYQCARCCQVYTLFEKFNIHYIPLPPPPEKRYILQRSQKNEKKPELVECLKSFQNAQFMTGDDKMNCARCRKDMDTKKKMAIYKANKVLVIGLKRFHQGLKNDIKIDIPLELNPSQFIECESEYRNKVYKLYAVLLHSGTLRGGHYKAVCYNPQDKVQSWMEYDDSYVRRCSIKDIHEQNVYGLFYSLADRQEIKKQPVKSRNYPQSHITKAPY